MMTTPGASRVREMSKLDSSDVAAAVVQFVELILDLAEFISSVL